MNRTEKAYYKEQTPQFIKARDKVKKYLHMTHFVSNRSTYSKVMGVTFNGVKNGHLSVKDVELINHGIDKVQGLLSEFKAELNR